METIKYDTRQRWANGVQKQKRSNSVDQTFHLELNGSMQRIRLCAENAATPPVLVIQGGPGYPLLHEVRKFQQRLTLERELTVCYWDQRGCGPAKKKDMEGVSFRQQVDDLRALIRWVRENSGQKVTLMGISFGATISLLAAEQEMESIKALVAISPDINIAEMDASVAEYLSKRASAMSRRYRSAMKQLGEPPYNEPAKLQLRARLLADSGAIENGRRFMSLATEMFVGLIRTYGPSGTVRSLRNMNAIQSRILPEVNNLNVLTDLPSFEIPVHCIVGGRDPIVPSTARQMLSDIQGYVLTEIPEAGHMAHFDHPDIVRSIVLRAAGLHPDHVHVQ